MLQRNMRVQCLGALIGLLVACGVSAVAAFGQTAGSRTVRDGVFSAAQVQRGRRQFEYVCMNCHEIEEFTGVGAYLEDMDGKTLWDAFEYIWAEMPEDDPASLDPQDYAAVLAYLLSVYGLSTGDVDMPIDRRSLDSIAIVRPIRPGS
jgi:mono/diheme cytochrome c family protein